MHREGGGPRLWTSEADETVPLTEEKGWGRSRNADSRSVLKVNVTSVLNQRLNGLTSDRG